MRNLLAAALAGVAISAVMQAPAAAAATTLYVAVNGSDGNAGTISAPFATIQKAITTAVAGDTIAVRGGTYGLAANIPITKSGTAAAPYTLTAYGTERVIIDGEALGYTPGAVGSTIPAGQRGAIHMEASYWRLIGLEIVNGPYGIYCAGCNNNTFERLSTHDNYETGFQLQGASANNLILNLDSYGNRDPRKNGESADGLGIKEGTGTGNVVRGARLWNNVDDGFDAWLFTSPITIQNTLAYGNGYNRWSIPNFSGDGNGLKLGGSSGTGPAAAHAVSNAFAWGNAAHGFTDNGNTGAITINRSTAYQNVKTGFDVDGGSTTRLTANLALGNATAVALGSSTASGNSWNIGGTWTVLSTDASTITGARNTDGSIRTSNYLVPSNGSAVGAKI
ncbi:right-handed parallel beta-helix repeat-containing protein [Actinoplanes derwentensis]|uniref:Right handed beta helix region n=1 Tax=Actinoplanes derwentensis TaxID=113562 RepID=A0A1H1YV56_9ACTN|nr:right-handed parallel beta-helix repeat-containing protein [Actinoplanes derwentensis]GID81304.1 silent information regulator protein Sir2 [Actinoplanes derwentensis]SDT25290.1 Right handed beta helix region [Actinoplanes derwentensis]